MSIYLIRHAQSVANAAYLAGEPDLMLEDVPLSDLGHSQALKARAVVADLDIKQLIVSPLTRTLQTADLIFERRLPIKINANVREQLCNTADVGTHPNKLGVDWPHLDFSHLEGIWWHQGEPDHRGVEIESKEILDQRAADFVEFAKHTKITSTAIVTHGNFIRALTGTQPENCQVLKLDI